VPTVPESIHPLIHPFPEGLSMSVFFWEGKADLVRKLNKVLVCTRPRLEEGADSEYEEEELEKGPTGVVLMGALDVALDDG